MKLIVGLGNPGKNYINTRHNCGFRAIDFYATKNQLKFKNKFDGEYSEIIINNEKIILLKPQTFMNLSGECVSKFVKYYNIELTNILIIYDDIDFEVGNFKIKRGGTSNGHKGLENILNLLKSENISRIKIGISKNKAFYITTSKEEQVKEYLINKLHHTVTIFDVKGGFLQKKRRVLLAVVPTRDYFRLKEGIKEIDPKAFFVVTDAYEVGGGK